MADPKAQPPTVVIRPRRRRAHAGHHGGAWKVAYADFITCMFALFLVMWLLTQADMKLRQEIAQYFRQPGILAGGSILGDDAAPRQHDRPQVLDAAPIVVPGTGENLSALRGQAGAIREAVEHSPELAEIREQVRVSVTDEGLEIQVIDSGAGGRDDLLFDLSSAALKPALVSLLAEIAAHLGTLPNAIEIGGHTDARPFPADSVRSNWDLSYQRADNARRVMESHGLRPGQVLRIAAYGNAKPLRADDPRADENRRLSVIARPLEAATAAEPEVARVEPFESPEPPAAAHAEPPADAEPRARRPDPAAAEPHARLPDPRLRPRQSAKIAG